MTDMKETIAGAVFNRLGIIYKNLPCGKGEFYFCTIPSTGITFDLSYEEGKYVKLWRIICTNLKSKARQRYEYNRLDYQNSVIGIEVSDDGEVCFYAEQRIIEGDNQLENKIARMIEGFVSIVSDKDFEVKI